MTTQFINCYMMRGGTSRGAYFFARDLPEDEAIRNKILLQVMGSPDPRQIDGMGGGSMLTSKVAIVSPSERKGVDLDYAFYQVYVDKAEVDSSPTCGNILTAVGCFGIEGGLIKAGDPETEVTVYDVNTGYLVRQRIQTPNGKVTYEGGQAIAGVPGTAAPVAMAFSGIAGAKTGKVFSTGNRMDLLEGKRMSCLDVAMPTIFLSAKEWGITGYESKQELDAHPDLIERLLAFRKKAALLMGFGDIGESVIPKVAFVAAPKDGGNICGRYFTPFQCHDAFALSAAFGAAAGSLLDGTLLNELSETPGGTNGRFSLEHPAGKMEMGVSIKEDKETIDIETEIVRTCRLIMRGSVALPSSLS